MATVVNQTEQRIVLYDVSWATYEHLLADHLDCSSPRITYDEGTLEIMSPSNEHEETNRAIASLVEALAEEWEIDLMNLGSTTLNAKISNVDLSQIRAFTFEMPNGFVGKMKSICTMIHRLIW